MTDDKIDQHIESAFDDYFRSLMRDAASSVQMVDLLSMREIYRGRYVEHAKHFLEYVTRNGGEDE